MALPPPGHPHYMPEGERSARTLSMVAEREELYRIDTAEKEKRIMPASPAQKKYQELRTKIAEARKTMEATAKGLFTEMSTELFNANPTLMSFSWTQYTPYFNDGDVCEFSCHSDYPTVSMMVDGQVLGYNTNSGEFEVDGEEVETADEYVRKFRDMGVDSFTKNGKSYAYDKKTNAVTVDGEKIKTYDQQREVFEPLEEAVKEFMRTFEEEDMEVMFGDHVQVTVDRDGSIDIEDYQHD